MKRRFPFRRHFPALGYCSVRMMSVHLPCHSLRSLSGYSPAYRVRGSGFFFSDLKQAICPPEVHARTEKGERASRPALPVTVSHAGRLVFGGLLHLFLNLRICGVVSRRHPVALPEVVVELRG